MIRAISIAVLGVLVVSSAHAAPTYTRQQCAALMSEATAALMAGMRSGNMKSPRYDELRERYNNSNCPALCGQAGCRK
jgi:hypothetical protein